MDSKRISREDAIFCKVLEYVLSSHVDLKPKTKYSTSYVYDMKDNICKRLKLLYDSKNIKFYEMLSLYHKRSRCGYFCRESLKYPDITFIEKERVEKEFLNKLELDLQLEMRVWNSIMDRMILNPSLELDDKLYYNTRIYITEIFEYPLLTFTTSTTIRKKDKNNKEYDIYTFCKDYIRKDPQAFFTKYFGKTYKSDIEQKLIDHIENTFKDELMMIRKI